MTGEKRTVGYWVLAAFFVLFVLFLYGPMSAIFPPMRRVSFSA